MYELKQIMRQNNVDFAELLNRIRIGSHTQRDIDVLMTRVWKHPDPPPCSPCNPHLFITNEKVENHNLNVFRNSNEHKVEIVAKDIVVGSMTRELRSQILDRIPSNPQKTMQLYGMLQVAVGVQYDLSINYRTEDGLTNGATCQVKKLAMNTNTPSGIIWVQFVDKEIGKLTRAENKRLYRNDVSCSWTPIFPLNRQFAVGKSAQVMRTQFPLRPATAKTIHRSQGDTIKTDMVVNFTGRSSPHIHYVALSRVDTLEHLHIVGLNPRKITVSNPVLQEMERLRSNSLQCTLPLSDSKSLVAYINAQSLHRHLPDLESDMRLNKAHILICSETRLMNNDMDRLSQFECVFRNDEITSSSTHRPFHGMAVYSKEQLNPAPVVANTGPVECVITAVHVKDIGQVKIASIYAVPSTSPCVLQGSLSQIIEEHELSSASTIFIGDFNVDVTD